MVFNRSRLPFQCILFPVHADPNRIHFLYAIVLCIYYKINVEIQNIRQFT